MGREELQSFFARHMKNIGDGFPFEFDLQRLTVVSSSTALFARHIDIGQEMHFDLYGAVT